jgi:hypothetical protein
MMFATGGRSLSLELGIILVRRLHGVFSYPVPFLE